MSIWCSHDLIGGRHDQVSTGQVRSYATGWSNHYPTADGTVEQPAAVEVAHMAPWCVPGNEDVDDEWDERGRRMVGDWLRLRVESVAHDVAGGGKPSREQQVAAVVMDETAVRALHHELGQWLTARKTHPDHSPAT